MNIFASDILFYVFGALAVILSLMVVFMRNPVSSAMMMALSFGATAAVMIGLGAHFLGILQILVYAGAIMVLFAFIIMLLNVKLETSPFRRPVSVAVGVIIAGLFLGQLIGIIYSLPGAKDCGRCPMASAEQAWNDLKIGQNEANEATECNAGVACGLRASTSAFTNAEIDRLINNGQQQGNVESAQAPGAAASGKHGVNGLPLDKIAICGQKQRNYAFSGNSIDCLLLSSSIQAPRITLPPLSPKCSAHLYPEGTTIRAEINNGEFPDTALLGRTLFDKYNRTLVIAGLALLVASIGVVVLSRRLSGK